MTLTAFHKFPGAKILKITNYSLFGKRKSKYLSTIKITLIVEEKKFSIPSLCFVTCLLCCSCINFCILSDCAWIVSHPTEGHEITQFALPDVLIERTVCHKSLPTRWWASDLCCKERSLRIIGVSRKCSLFWTQYVYTIKSLFRILAKFETVWSTDTTVLLCLPPFSSYPIPSWGHTRTGCLKLSEFFPFPKTSCNYCLCQFDQSTERNSSYSNT